MMTRIPWSVLAVASAIFCLSPLAAIANLGDCGQPISAGATPAATDALGILKDAVGASSSCQPEPCICDVNGDGNVTASDALQVLKVAVGQPVGLGCDCGAGACVTFGYTAGVTESAGPTAAAAVPTRQVFIEVKLIGVDVDSFDQLGIASELDGMAAITTDAGPALGGTNGDGRTLAVDSNAIGGPANLQYLLYGTHEPDGALAILNKNFTSPFSAVKTFFLVPPDLCAIFTDQVVSEPQNFPGMTPVQNLPPVDVGLGGGQLLYTMRSANDASALLSTIQADARNTVLIAPDVTVFSGQSLLHMVNDVQAGINDVDSNIRANIQAVTPQPFGNFTGVALDLVPTVNEGDSTVTLDIRVKSDIVSFYLSTAFQVDGVPVDAEIPVLRRSRAVSSVIVPDQQTVVIGGLLREDQMTMDKGLPFIGDLPLIGALFSHQQLDPTNQTLMVFITPRIVTSQ